MNNTSKEIQRIIPDNSNYLHFRGSFTEFYLIIQDMLNCFKNILLYKISQKKIIIKIKILHIII